MKKFVFAIAVILFTGFSTRLCAQEEIDQIQKEWGKEKKELIRLGMGLNASDSVKFWPVYNRYEKERQKLGKERIMILDDYVNHYADLSNAKSDELINKIFKNDASLAKLQQQYYITLKNTLNAKQAAKFLQIETYIHSAIRSLIQEQLPFIDELEHMKKEM